MQPPPVPKDVALSLMFSSGFPVLCSYFRCSQCRRTICKPPRPSCSPPTSTARRAHASAPAISVFVFYFVFSADIPHDSLRSGFTDFVSQMVFICPLQIAMTALAATGRAPFAYDFSYARACACVQREPLAIYTCMQANHATFCSIPPSDPTSS